MKITLTVCIFLIAASPLIAQEKGVDTQTSTIKKESRPTNRGDGVSRTFDWGSGKTKVRDRFPNPIRIPSRRDILLKSIVTILNDEKFLVDESASQFEQGLVVTQPKIFARGAILTKNELFRYANVPSTDQIWTRGRYTLMIDVRSIDGMKNDVSVVATVEGRSENGLFSEWSTLESSGTAEDEFLAKLVTYVGGDIDSSERQP